jgi:hypothetical protein
MRRASDGDVVDFTAARRQRAGVTLADLQHERLWVSWREEPREPGGKPTKIPYDPRTGRQAASDNPETWGTQQEALQRAEKLLRDGRTGGIGIMFCSIDDLALCGVDLDTCFANGVIEPWAEAVIERFGSYAEISPSRTGVKIFATIALADLPVIQAIIGGGHGLQWKRGGGDHPPAIELHVSHRYFATTFERLPDSPAELRPIDTAAVEWLVREAGPRFVSNGKKAAGKPARDNSRSAIALRKGAALRRQGCTFEQMVETLRADPETADWVREKGEVNGGRELQRIWEKAAVDDFERDSKNVIIANSQMNVRLALGKLGVRVAHDVFADRTLVDGPDDVPRRHLGDPELEGIYLTLDARFGFRPSIDFFRMVVQDEARRNAFHPVRDYLAALHWDGTPRLEKWLAVYADAEDSEYVRAVGRLVLVAAVRRVRQPGCKFDEMLVLESRQGLDKSSALGVLAIEEQWFTDSLPLNADDKKVIETLKGRWIVEAAELQGLRKGDVEHLKAFLSRRVDRGRPAYGRLPIEAPRQCVIVGTTNHERYLRDSTGNRRFWPVRVACFDLDALRRDRDQIWAEAAAIEAKGESIRLDPRLYPDAGRQQEARTVEDPWIEVIDDALGDHYGKMRVKDAWVIVNVPTDRRTQDHNQRLGDAMRGLGWQRVQRRFAGKRDWAYVKRHPKGEDRDGTLLPIIHVSRGEISGDLDIFVGQSERG